MCRLIGGTTSPGLVTATNTVKGGLDLAGSGSFDLILFDLELLERIGVQVLPAPLSSS
ncbi:MAG: hypothetical protein ABSG91_05715 [Syntrophobacteraceae bacterium]